MDSTLFNPFYCIFFSYIFSIVGTFNSSEDFSKRHLACIIKTEVPVTQLEEEISSLIPSKTLMDLVVNRDTVVSLFPRPSI